MKKIAVIGAFALAAGCAQTPPAPSPEAKSQLAPSGTLRVAVLTSNPIIGVKDASSGEVKGTTVDLGRALAAGAGVPARILDYPAIPQLMADAATNTWDVAVVAIDPARRSLVDFAPAHLAADGFLTILVPPGSSARSRTPRSARRTTRTTPSASCARERPRATRRTVSSCALARRRCRARACSTTRSRGCSSPSRCRRTGRARRSTSPLSSRTRKNRARFSARSTRPASPARSRSLRPRKSKKLAPGLGSVGQEVRIGALLIRGFFSEDPIGPGVFPDLGGAQAIDLGGVETEDLGAHRRGDFSITKPISQWRGNLESAEGLDLVLRRAVPDRVGAPKHVVLPAVADQLAHRVRSLLGLAHEEAPRAAQLGKHVGT